MEYTPIVMDHCTNPRNMGELKDANGEFKSIIKEFELNSDGKIEVRTFYGGKGELKIKELTIYKDKKLI